MIVIKCLQWVAKAELGAFELVVTAQEIRPNISWYWREGDEV